MQWPFARPLVSLAALVYLFGLGQTAWAQDVEYVGAPQDFATTPAKTLIGLFKEGYTYSLRFRQSVRNVDDHSLISRRSGQLWMSPDGRFRLEIEPPFSEITVGLSDRVEVFDPDLEQVQIRSRDITAAVPIEVLVARDPAALTEIFAVTGRINPDGSGEFTLEPHDSGAIVTDVHVDVQGGRMFRLRAQNALGQEVQFEFSSMVESKDPFAESTFRLNIPPGTAIWDSR